MTTVLAFDTSAPSCAAALFLHGKMITHVEDMARGQGERLMPMLEQILAENGCVWADLDGIGVGTGPGNFTGIRISVSAARGLALGLGKPSIGVSGFETAAFGLRNVIACLPAPRDQAYVQARVSGADQTATLVDLNDMSTFPQVPALAEARFCGPAANDVAAAYIGQVATAADIAQQPVPAIEAIARTASSRLTTRRDRPAPMYVKPPDAAPPRDKPPLILP